MAYENPAQGATLSQLLGGGIWLLVPWLSWRAIRPHASNGARRGGYIANAIAIAIPLVIVAISAFNETDWAAGAIGLLILASPFAFNIYGIRKLASSTTTQSEPAAGAEPLENAPAGPLPEEDLEILVFEEPVRATQPLTASSARAAHSPSTTRSPTAEASRAPAKRGNYFTRHWRGDLSLPVSYWVNYILLGAVLVAIFAAVAPALDRMSLRAGSAVSIVELVLAVVVTVWSAIGVWRSANNHAARGGRRGWAVTAQLLIAIGLLGFVG